MEDKVALGQMMEHTKALNRIATALEQANDLRYVTLNAEQREALNKHQVATQASKHQR